MRLVVSVILVIYAFAAVSAQQYIGQIAYLQDTTCSDPTRNVGGGASLDAASCTKNENSATYGGLKCNTDKTVYSIACSDDACTQDCQFVANISACAPGPMGVYIHSVCFASYADVPVPTSGSVFVIDTFLGTTCSSPSTLVHVLWGPINFCVPGEPIDSQGIKISCGDAGLVNYSLYNNTACTGTAVVQPLQGCVPLGATTTTQAVCLAPATTSTTAAAATTDAATTGATTGGGGTTGGGATTSKTSTTTTSGASVVSAVVVMMTMPLIAILF